MEKHPSDSSVQRKVEQYVLSKLAKELRIPSLTNSSDKGFPISPDGFYLREKKGFCCEVYSRVGEHTITSANKVLKDALRLIYIEKSYKIPFRKMLVFVDPVSASKFLPHSSKWYGRVLNELGIEVKVVSISKQQRIALNNARALQKKGNTIKKRK